MTDPPPRRQWLPVNGDRPFFFFMSGIFGIMILWGCGMVVALVWSDETLAIRMINAFASMFAGCLGFGSGYLIASKRTNGNGNGKDH